MVDRLQRAARVELFGARRVATVEDIEQIQRDVEVVPTRRRSRTFACDTQRAASGSTARDQEDDAVVAVAEDAARPADSPWSARVATASFTGPTWPLRSRLYISPMADVGRQTAELTLRARVVIGAGVEHGALRGSNAPVHEPIVRPYM